MRKLFFISCFLLSSPLFAIIAPIHQSMNEMDRALEEIQKAVQEPKSAQKYFAPNETIQLIRREGDSFVVQSEEKQVIIDIIYLPSERTGPRQYKLVLHPSTAIDD